MLWNPFLSILNSWMHMAWLYTSELTTLNIFCCIPAWVYCWTLWNLSVWPIVTLKYWPLKQFIILLKNMNCIIVNINNTITITITISLSFWLSWVYWEPFSFLSLLIAIDAVWTGGIRAAFKIYYLNKNWRVSCCFSLFVRGKINCFTGKFISCE